ncbi:MAG: NADH-quinone oxidoreductase subunit N [Prevotellaceae bacterium]|jgi:NADH-quinone oxidoreductase subunit N|nr:NADH-quinone oxidoreductase subunit N [Prevotellaceae bacterium]
MDLSHFLFMRHELLLIAVAIVLLLFDLIASARVKKYHHLIACTLTAGFTVTSFLMHEETSSVFGGMYLDTAMHGLVKSLLAFGTLLTFLISNTWLAKPETAIKRGEFYVITLFTLVGMYLMISSGHFLMFYIGLETASIPMATLVAFDKYRRHSAEAGAKYILAAAFASAIMLYGLSMIYAFVGSLYFEDIAPVLSSTSYMCLIGLVFFLAGAFFKLSMVPFHLWTADVYEGAPTPVTAYLSVISKGSMAFAATVILYTVFGNMVDIWQPIFWWIILITITLANLFAVRQQNLKRLLAFSSISQAGYLALGIMSGTAMGMATVVYYTVAYLCSNFAAFGVIQAIEDKTGKVTLADYNGLYGTNPKLAITMMLAMFSLGGIPFFAGFFSKFFVFAAAAEQGQYLLVFLALLNTIISLYYYLLVVKAMFINKTDAPISTLKTDAYGRIALVACVLGMLFIGLISPIFDYIVSISFGM